MFHSAGIRPKHLLLIFQSYTTTLGLQDKSVSDDLISFFHLLHTHVHIYAKKSIGGKNNLCPFKTIGFPKLRAVICLNHFLIFFDLELP